MINLNLTHFSSDSTTDVDVAIIGAGPGGLAIAHALLKLGLNARVYERAKKLRPMGAALGLFPNAYHALEAIDPDLCDRILAVGVEPSKQIVQNAKGDILFEGESPFSNLKDKYGKPFQWMGWYNLQHVLRETLPSDIVCLDRCCTGFTQNRDRVTVHFDDRESVTAGLLVGADGINSIVRQALLDDGPPRYMNTMSWRAVIDRGERFSDPGEFRLISGEGKNFAIIDVGGGATCWTATALSSSDRLCDTLEEAKMRVLEEFKGWPDPVENIVRETDASRIVERGICDRLPVEKWGKGRVTLLGDAAHPMRPALGQGTGMAFEDAYELAAGLRSASCIEAAIEQYESDRIPRTKILQERAVSEGEKAYQKDRPDKLASASKNWTPDEFADWLYTRRYPAIGSNQP